MDGYGAKIISRLVLAEMKSWDGASHNGKSVEFV
jgi:hypothetical protein